MKDGYRRIIVLIIVVLTAFLLVSAVRMAMQSQGLLYFLKNKANPQELTKDTLPLPVDSLLTEKSVDVLESYDDACAELTRRVMPSVVSINTAGVEGKSIRDRYGRTSIQTSRTMGQGSGVVVSFHGHIITNYHVIANKQQIQIITADGKRYPAILIGTDPALDIAVLQVKQADKLKPLKFGNSDTALEGHRVYAFGNPFGIGLSVTDGIVSARERSLSDQQGGLLQSSAAINPGYSGGPLVNSRGEIIAINSNIFSNNDKNPSFQGISFSIPSNSVQRTLQDIVTRGKPVRGFLGISSTELDVRTREMLQYPNNHGAWITAVGKDTPAERANLKTNDIIISYDGTLVRDFKHLIGMIQRSRVGKKVELLVWRDLKKITTQATLAEQSFGDESHADEIAKIPNPKEILHKIGLDVRPISTNLRSSGIQGVIVNRVMPNSLATNLFRPNDIIYQLNQSPIHQPEHFYYLLLLASIQGETKIYIIRDGEVLPEAIVLPRIDQQ